MKSPKNIGRAAALEAFKAETQKTFEQLSAQDVAEISDTIRDNAPWLCETEGRALTAETLIALIKELCGDVVLNKRLIEMRDEIAETEDSIKDQILKELDEKIPLKDAILTNRRKREIDNQIKNDLTDAERAELKSYIAWTGLGGLMGGPLSGFIELNGEESNAHSAMDMCITELVRTEQVTGVTPTDGLVEALQGAYDRLCKIDKRSDEIFSALFSSPEMMVEVMASVTDFAVKEFGRAPGHHKASEGTKGPSFHPDNKYAVAFKLAEMLAREEVKSRKKTPPDELAAALIGVSKEPSMGR
jgi:hypothetical protein